MSTNQHEHIAKSLVDGLFRDMQDPAFQGAAFSWEKFPGMAKGMVEANLFLYYKKLPKNFENVKVLAGQYALDHAAELVAEHEKT